MKCDKEGHPASHCPEFNKNYGNKKKSNDNKSSASRFRKSSKSSIGKLKKKTKNTFTKLEANIDELGDEDSDLTSSDSEDRSGNSHFQLHNKSTSFTGTKKFKTDPED